METTRDKARRYIKENRIKEALKLCRKFDQIYSKSEIRIMEITYECYTGKKEFYKSLGINLVQNYKEAIDLLDKMKPHPYVENTKKLNK